MGTRSTIKFVRPYVDKVGNKKEMPFVNIYQQYDGYISGVGYELAEWLLKKKLCNGFSCDMDDNEYANGIGCLAAQFIRDHKEELGGLYITTLDDTEDYNYTVLVYDESGDRNYPYSYSIRVTNFDNPEPIFEGTPKELLNFKEGE